MPTETVVASQAPWEPQQPYIRKGWDAASSLFDMGLPGFYPGPTVAGFDPVQKQAQEQTLAYLQGPELAAMQGDAGSALQRSLTGYTGFSPGQTSDLLAGNVRTGPGTPYGAMESALTQGVMRRLGEDILPGIRSQQQAYQRGGGSRGTLASNRAISDAVTQGMTLPMAQMYSNAYSQAQNMRLPAAQMGIQQQQFGQRMYPTIANQPLSMFGAMNTIGNARRNLTQAGIDADRSRYAYESMLPWQNLAQYQGATGGNWGGQSAATYPTQGKDPSIIGGIAGAAMGNWGGGGFGSLFS